MFLSLLDLFLQCVSVKNLLLSVISFKRIYPAHREQQLFHIRSSIRVLYKNRTKNRGKKNRLCLSVFLCLCRRNLLHIFGFLFIQRPAACDKDAAEQ